MEGLRERLKVEVDWTEQRRTMREVFERILGLDQRQPLLGYLRELGDHELWTIQAAAELGRRRDYRSIVEMKEELGWRGRDWSLFEVIANRNLAADLRRFLLRGGSSARRTTIVPV